MTKHTAWLFCAFGSFFVSGFFSGQNPAFEGEKI